MAHPNRTTDHQSCPCCEKGLEEHLLFFYDPLITISLPDPATQAQAHLPKSAATPPLSNLESTTEEHEDQGDSRPDSPNTETPPPPPPPLVIARISCSRPHCTNETAHVLAKRCGNCRAVFYCSRSCQKIHWSCHKPTCIPFEEAPSGGRYARAFVEHRGPLLYAAMTRYLNYTPILEFINRYHTSPTFQWDIHSQIVGVEVVAMLKNRKHKDRRSPQFLNHFTIQGIHPLFVHKLRGMGGKEAAMIRCDLATTRNKSDTSAFVFKFTLIPDPTEFCPLPHDEQLSTLVDLFTKAFTIEVKHEVIKKSLDLKETLEDYPISYTFRNCPGKPITPTRDHSALRYHTINRDDRTEPYLYLAPPPP